MQSPHVKQFQIPPSLTGISSPPVRTRFTVIRGENSGLVLVIGQLLEHFPHSKHSLIFVFSIMSEKEGFFSTFNSLEDFPTFFFKGFGPSF